MADAFDSLSDPPLAASLRLVPDHEPTSQARTFVRDFCTAAGFASDFCDVAVLLVDELVEKMLVDDEAAATVEIQRAGAGLRPARESPGLVTGGRLGARRAGIPASLANVKRILI